MKALHSIRKWFDGMARSFRREWTLVFSDAGVLLFFVALPLLYPIAYTLIYNPETVTNLPIAVVDNDRSEASRALVRDASASPTIEIYAYCANLGDAKELMAEGKVYGIMEIPADYSRCIATGRQANVPFYSEMSLLLRYRAFVSALTDLQLKIAQDVTIERIDMAGAAPKGVTSLPVNQHSNFLGDEGQGFASFIIPGIVILIIQQSMVLGIVLIGGTSRERRKRNGGIDPLMVSGAPHSAATWGRALCHTMFYIPLTIYVAHYIPEIFNLPHSSNAVDYLLFLFPLLLASSFFGQTLQVAVNEREDSFIVIVFTSVVFLFLSGLTWPRYAMNTLWVWLGNIVPATWGIEGFVRINSNGATLAETDTAYLWLWALTAVYFLTAWRVSAYIDTRSRRRYKNYRQ